MIGNLTRDPELRYTPAGTAVCTFGLATNRSWTTDSGEKKEEADFHRIVSWNKLAELCSQLLTKGRKVYVEGRIQTRNWQGQDGQPRSTTEIVIDDMIILDSKRTESTHEASVAGGQLVEPAPAVEHKEATKTEDAKEEVKEEAPVSSSTGDVIDPNDIPF